MCNLNSSKDLLPSENNSTYSYYSKKKMAKKTEYTISDNSYTLFKNAKPHYDHVLSA